MCITPVHSIASHRAPLTPKMTPSAIQAPSSHTAIVRIYLKLLKIFGSGGGTRTPDTRIMIPLL